ncbi:MAG: hypothetical protein IPL63_16000 [Saprospiraceae bacterium]|nr:hypothetical protein [Saprospiraceae bacterium]MBK7523481.1 hypothetical protein [Saprospiraceae bacterium]MBK8079582.1 hypothetical protein [Saprospiraceae bacterium]MBK8371531.1 hypothetical protein [Saprospiraceae bacterium]MBK8548796.1 hypothetical protein [Saprospiraceae bacterium]
MALSFHYKGSLKEASLLSDLIFEIEDICDTLRWKVKVFENSFPDNQFTETQNDKDYGIILTPPLCEPVSFVFDSTGKICNPMLKDILSKEGGNKEIKVITVQLDLNDDNPEPVISENNKDFNLEDIIHQVSIKNYSKKSTDYVQLLELIRYLSNKFLKDFSLTDEFGYWNSGDIHKLTKRMDSAQWLMDSFQQKLSEKSFSNPEEFIDFLKQLGTILKKSIKDEEE